MKVGSIRLNQKTDKLYLKVDKDIRGGTNLTLSNPRKFQENVPDYVKFDVLLHLGDNKE